MALKTDETHVRSIDTFRLGVDGVIQALTDSIFILVAIQFFAVGDFWKGLIPSSRFIGYFLSSPLNAVLNRSGIRRSRTFFALTLTAAAALALGSIVPNGVVYAIAVSLCSAACHLRQPFFTDLYGEFYHSENRARQISLGLRLNLAITLGTGLGCGYILDQNLNWWRWINGCTVVFLLAVAFFLLRLPERNSSIRNESWLSAITLPFRNARFVYVETAWMLVGFGNLWTLPLRAIYLAESERGMALSPSMVTLILVVIPVGFQFLFNRFWARRYHEISFPAMRIAINAFFAVAIPLCFFTTSIPLIMISSALLGIGLSGTPFIWQLWVTRIVRIEDIRMYQSAHALLAGLRGMIAPFIGFMVLKELTFKQMGAISSALTVLSCLMMIPLFRRDRIF